MNAIVGNLLLLLCGFAAPTGVRAFYDFIWFIEKTSVLCLNCAIAQFYKAVGQFAYAAIGLPSIAVEYQDCAKILNALALYKELQRKKKWTEGRAATTDKRKDKEGEYIERDARNSLQSPLVRKGRGKTKIKQGTKSDTDTPYNCM